MKQEYLKRKEIQFWGNDLWPGNSPDLNPTENLGEVVKNRVEEKMHKEIGPGRYSEETLLKNLNMVLGGLEHDTDLFGNLLCSMPERLRQVKDAERGPTLFYRCCIFWCCSEKLKLNIYSLFLL